MRLKLINFKYIISAILLLLNLSYAEEICKLSNTPYAQLIKDHESFGGDYGAYNSQGGTKNGRNPNIPNMTIAEVMSEQAKNTFFAVGAYQIIPSTLREAVTSLGLDRNAKFDKKMQDFIFDEYLVKKKGGRTSIHSYFYKGGDIHRGALATAQEWSSMPIKAGTVNNRGKVATSNCGWSYYSNSVDKSRICYETLIYAMEVSKRQLESNACNPSENVNKDAEGHQNDKDNPFEIEDTDFSEKDGGGRVRNKCGGCWDYGIAQRLGRVSNRQFDMLDLETLREIEQIAVKINKAHQILEVESKNILIQNQKLLELQAEVKGNISYNQRVILELQSIINSIDSEGL